MKALIATALPAMISAAAPVEAAAIAQTLGHANWINGQTNNIMRAVMRPLQRELPSQKTLLLSFGPGHPSQFGRARGGIESDQERLVRGAFLSQSRDVYSLRR